MHCFHDNDGVLDLKKRVVLMEEEKYQVSLQLKEFESDQHRLEHQIELQQRKEMEMAQTMAREARRHDDDVNMLNKQLSHTQSELAVAMRDKADRGPSFVFHG